MKKMIIAAALAVAATTNVMAGGLLTNTNQSINFLRNPARDAAIGIDGVYSNPAGVAFMNEGFHLGVNWQAAFQTRQIDTTNPLFALGAKNNGATTKHFEGKASAPVIPSLQAAYNTGKWSFQFNFAVHGGGGKCTFDEGLGSFESVISNYAVKFGQLNDLKQLSALGVPGVQNIPTAVGYDMNSFLQGKQYYFGFTLGAAYKVNDHLSVYGGARVLYGSAAYKVNISDISVVTPNGNVALAQYVGAVSGAMTEAGAFAQNPANQQAMVAGLTQQMMAAGMDMATAQAAAMQKVQGALGSLQGAANEMGAAGTALQPYLAHGVKLQSDQTGVGIAPIIGVDYCIGNFNFAGKYEFRTRMALENKSDVAEASIIDAVNKFRDGSKIREDNPAMLSLGAQWDALPNLHVNAGYHHFYDTDSKKYGDEQKKLDGGTNEYLGGVEYDINDKLSASAGFQVTRYGLTDAFMNDMSFVCNSWSFGLGASYKVADNIKVEVAYFQTNYDHYKTEPVNGVSNDFYRTNRVLGAGVTFDF